MMQITTDHVGIAIQDALNLLKDGIECEGGRASFFVDDSDYSNLRIIIDEIGPRLDVTFVVRIVREG